MDNPIIPTSDLVDKVRPKCNNPKCVGYTRQRLLFYRREKLWKCILCGSQSSVTDSQMKVIGERKYAVNY